MALNLEKEKKKAYRQGLRDAERNCAIMFMYALRNEFEFGNKRMRQMADQLTASADALFSRYCSLDDMNQVLHDECNISLVEGIGIDYRYTDIVHGKCERCHSDYQGGNYCPWCGAEILEVRE